MAAAPGRGAVILLLLAAIAASYWAWRSGALEAKAQAILAGLVGAAGLWGFFKGEWLTGSMLIGIALGWSVLRRPPRARSTMRADEAYRVLELAPGSDADAVRQAHRRLVRKVHPDQGGSADLAARVNAARDALLAELGHPRAR